MAKDEELLSGKEAKRRVRGGLEISLDETKYLDRKSKCILVRNKRNRKGFTITRKGGNKNYTATEGDLYEEL